MGLVLLKHGVEAKGLCSFRCHATLQRVSGLASWHPGQAVVQDFARCACCVPETLSALPVFFALGPPHSAHSSGAHVSPPGLSAPVPVMALTSPNSPDLLSLVPPEPGPPAGLHPSLSLLPGIPENGAASVPSVCPASG